RRAVRRPGVDAIPLVCLRLLGGGGMVRTAARRAARRGLRFGGPLTDGLPRPAGRRKGHRLEPISVGGADAVAAGTGFGGVGDRRGTLPARTRGPLGARAGDRSEE